MSADSTPTRHWPRAVLALIGAAALVTATAGVVTAAGSAGKIHGCVGHGGTLRIAQRCSSSEVALSWNKSGPRGLRGPAGIPRGYVGRLVSTSKTTGVTLAHSNHVITHTPAVVAGTYLISATVNLAMYTGTGSTCRVTSLKGNKSIGGQHAEAQTPPGSAGANADLAMNALLVHAVKGDEIQVVCRDYHQGSKATSVNNAEINATKVDDLGAFSQTFR